MQPGVRQREQPRGYTSAGARTQPVRTCGANFGTRHGSQRTVMGPAWPGRGDAVRHAGGAVSSTGHGIHTRAVHVCGCGVCEQTHPCMHPALCARQVQCCQHGTTVSVRVGHVGGGAGHAHEGGGGHCVGMARPHPRRTQTTEIFSGLGHQPEGHLSAAVQPRPRPGAPTEHPNVSAAPSGRAPRKHPGVSVVRGGSGLATAEAAVAKTRPAWAPVGAEPFPAPRAARGALWRPGTAQVWRWRGRQG